MYHEPRYNFDGSPNKRIYGYGAPTPAIKSTNLQIYLKDKDKTGWVDLINGFNKANVVSTSAYTSGSIYTMGGTEKVEYVTKKQAHANDAGLADVGYIKMSIEGVEYFIKAMVSV